MTAAGQTGPAPDGEDDNARLIVLRSLVAKAYDEDYSCQVVLQVGGLFVSGTVVGAERWHEALIGDPAVVEEVRQEIASTDQDEDHEPTNPFTVRNICLVDVELNGATITRLPAWQVPLARVEGWTLGSLSRRTATAVADHV